jgi:hypothetical protein
MCYYRKVKPTPYINRANENRFCPILLLISHRGKILLTPIEPEQHPWVFQNVIYHQSTRGQEQHFWGMSRWPLRNGAKETGGGPWDILRKSFSCQSFNWWYNILIQVRGTGIPMYFLFLPTLSVKEYYSYPHSAGRNNIHAQWLV